MEHARLGTTDITIPRLCIGGMSFGKAFPDLHQWGSSTRRPPKR